MPFIRIASHRARKKVQERLDRKPQTYFSWERTIEALEVTDEEVIKVNNIKGVTRCRRTDDLRRCWDL